eukprot:gnl/Chilomastix_caulleri/2957.p1 GENE.gnl/Chilomastix_caulleri/2957~~gnl/Chilomastix_caulleri/2957.p1  ORF type:complete len:134 (+),score=32.44 gnl/Chilomastix_caulleri/2957:389-790(+)
MKTLDGVARGFGTDCEGRQAIDYINSDCMGDQKHYATYRREGTNTIEVALIKDGTMKFGTISAGIIKWERIESDLPEDLAQEDIECVVMNDGKGFIFTGKKLFHFAFGGKEITEIEEYVGWRKEVSSSTTPPL